MRYEILYCTYRTSEPTEQAIVNNVAIDHVPVFPYTNNARVVQERPPSKRLLRG